MTIESAIPRPSFMGWIQTAGLSLRRLFKRRGFRALLAVSLLGGIGVIVLFFALALRFERIAMNAGIVHVTELEWEGRVVEVEGYDQHMRELRMILDLRSGAVLARSDRVVE